LNPFLDEINPRRGMIAFNRRIVPRQIAGNLRTTRAERSLANRKPVQDKDYWQIANDRDAPADAAKGGSKWHSYSIEKV
jgi:hypothetical protein